MRIDYHRTLIADTGRNTALMAALGRVIVPGQSIVADIGAGTGLIGFMAARLGAKSVTLYESEAVIQVAREIARANKLRNVHFVPMHSTAVETPEKADVIVSETLGNYAFEETSSRRWTTRSAGFEAWRRFHPRQRRAIHRASNRTAFQRRTSMRGAVSARISKSISI